VNYKAYPSAVQAARAAEALGRLYAASVGKPWPMPPDVYGPGRQPAVRSDFYQENWQAVQDPSGPTAQDPAAPVLPLRIVVDAVAVNFNGQSAIISKHGTGNETLDFTGLQVAAAQMMAERAAVAPESDVTASPQNPTVVMTG
jgi:hypothetical protein